MDLFALDKFVFNYFTTMSAEEEFKALLFLLMCVYVWSGTFHSKVKKK